MNYNGSTNPATQQGQVMLGNQREMETAGMGPGIAAMQGVNSGKGSGTGAMQGIMPFQNSDRLSPMAGGG